MSSAEREGVKTSIALINCNIQKSQSDELEILVHTSTEIRESDLQIDASTVLQPRFTLLDEVLNVAPNQHVNVVAKIIHTGDPDLRQ